MRRIPTLLAVLSLFLCAVAGAQAPITTSSVTASASSVYLAPLTAASLTCDGSELTGDLHGNSSTGVGMWLSANGGGGSALNNPAGVAGPAWLLYQFNEPYVLDSVAVWNHNQQGLTNRGLRNVSIHVSPNASGSSWTLVGNHTVPQAPGTPGYGPGTTITLGNAYARRVLITAATANGNYGSTYYGLSEVRFVGTAAGCVPPDYPVMLTSAAVDPVYDGLLVPRPSGWIGSDIAHSIPVSTTRSLWLFGDTFVGTVSGGARQPGAAFINNSIGIHDRSGGPPGTVSFHYGSGPSSFFPHQPGTPGTYYWPTSGVEIGGEAFVFCYSIGPGSGLFPFTIAGTTVLRISNPLDPPTSWTVTARDMGIGGNGIGFHSAMIEEGAYLYLLGYEDTGGRRAVLARIATADLVAGSTSTAYQYWVDTGGGPQWSASLGSTANLVTLFEPGITETDLQYEPSWGLYFCTTYNPFAPEILLTVAPALTGPWSDPVCIYDMPEHNTISFDVITYAVRAHPELSTQAGEIVLTYATNSLGSLAPLFTTEGLAVYYPRFVRVQVADNSNAGVVDWALY